MGIHALGRGKDRYMSHALHKFVPPIRAALDNLSGRYDLEMKVIVLPREKFKTLSEAYAGYESSPCREDPKYQLARCNFR